MATFASPQILNAIINPGGGAALSRGIQSLGGGLSSLRQERQQTQAQQSKVSEDQEALFLSNATRIKDPQKRAEFMQQGLQAGAIDQDDFNAISAIPFEQQNAAIFDTFRLSGRENLIPSFRAGKGGLASAKTETYPNGTVLQALPNGTTQLVAPNGVVVTDPNERIKVLEAAEASGVARGTNIARGKAVGTAEGQASTAEIAAKTAGKIETAKEKGKQEQQLNFRPRIQKAVARAKAAGDDEEKLAALKANIPLVNDMADKLRALSSDATHTFGGRAFDFLAKESGFGATKGSTARAKYQAIIDNQVLPLLKATFGAAFTAAEGQRLAATLGDVNAAPAEKMAQLDAFLDSQQSQITGLERKLNPEAADANVGDLSDEDLFN